MPFRDWPHVARCPECQKPAAHFLPTVSREASKPHYLCSECEHMWIPDIKPEPAPAPPTQAA